MNFKDSYRRPLTPNYVAHFFEGHNSPMFIALNIVLKLPPPPPSNK